MESIRSEGSRHSLRKTSGPPVRRLGITGIERSRCRLEMSPEESPMSYKRVIQPDPDLVSSLLNFSTDEDESGDEDEEEEKYHGVTQENEKKEIKSSWLRQLAVDQLLHSPRPAMSRRHSVSVCQTPVQATKNLLQRHKISVDPEQEDSDDTSLSQISSFNSSPHVSVPGSPSYPLDTPAMHATLHSEFVHSDQWVAALQTLELTFEEVVHIRSVLARAELEALPLDNNLKEDVEGKKICFLCMKTKFSIFQWGSQCQMCCQQVCGKCLAKMRIPKEHFSSVPVFVLSPQNPSSPVTDEEPSFASKIYNTLSPQISKFGSVGSAPNSPTTKRKSTESPRPHSSTPRPASVEPTSLPLPWQQKQPTSSFLGDMCRALSREERKTSLLGTPLNVCLDCKEMVLQVIRAKKTARRLQMTKSLFLNLDPVYPKEELH